MRESRVTVSAGCARAIAAGVKTMLRTVTADPSSPCSLGEPGDRLWVRAHGDDAFRRHVRIASIRVERLQDIAAGELESEGGLWREFHDPSSTPRESFGRWWDSVHARAGTQWNDNPHVWVVAFEPDPVAPVDELTAAERDEIRALSLAVYPPAEWSDWPGRRIEWAEAQWCARIRDEQGVLASYIGIVLRDAAVDDVPVRVGGVGGIKTHPAARGRGYARRGIDAALQFFRDRKDVAFALLVCEPYLVPYYRVLGWTELSGTTRVRQRGETVAFTFNRVMTHPVSGDGPTAGTIDLRGAPW